MALTPMQLLRNRLLVCIEKIQESHPTIKNDRALIKFMKANKVNIHATAISKWKSEIAFPTIEQVNFICNYFKEYGATANFIHYGKD